MYNNRMIVCTNCKGSGWDPEGGICETCLGAGAFYRNDDAPAKDADADAFFRELSEMRYAKEMSRYGG